MPINSEHHPHSHFCLTLPERLAAQATRHGYQTSDILHSHTSESNSASGPLAESQFHHIIGAKEHQFFSTQLFKLSVANTIKGVRPQIIGAASTNQNVTFSGDGDFFLHLRAFWETV